MLFRSAAAAMGAADLAGLLRPYFEEAAPLHATAAAAAAAEAVAARAAITAASSSNSSSCSSVGSSSSIANSVAAAVGASGELGRRKKTVAPARTLAAVVAAAAVAGVSAPELCHGGEQKEQHHARSQQQQQQQQRQLHPLLRGLPLGRAFEPVPSATAISVVAAAAAVSTPASATGTESDASAAATGAAAASAAPGASTADSTSSTPLAQSQLAQSLSHPHSAVAATAATQSSSSSSSSLPGGLRAVAARAAAWLSDTGDVQSFSVLALALTSCFPPSQLSEREEDAAAAAPGARVTATFDVNDLVARPLRRLALHSYRELLRRLRLDVEAARVLKLSRIPALATEPLKGTAMADGGVADPSPSAPAALAAINNEPAPAAGSAGRRGQPLCGVCREGVAGLWVWCRGCGHGGHLTHVMDWFRTGAQHCPAGCGHACVEDDTLATGPQDDWA